MQAFDATTGRPIRTYTTTDPSILDRNNSNGFSGGLTPDGRSLIFTTYTGFVVLNTATGRQRTVRPLPNGTYSGDVAAVSTTGLVAAPGGDNSLYLLDARNGAPHGPTLQVTGTQSRNVAFSADGARVVAASDDGGIREWDTKTGQ